MTAYFLSRIALLWGYGNCFLNWSSFFWRYYILCHMHYIYTRLVFCAGVNILNFRQGLFSTTVASPSLCLLCRYIVERCWKFAITEISGLHNVLGFITCQLIHYSSLIQSVICGGCQLCFHCPSASLILIWILKYQFWFYHIVIWTEPF